MAVGRLDEKRCFHHQGGPPGVGQLCRHFGCLHTAGREFIGRCVWTAVPTFTRTCPTQVNAAKACSTLASTPLDFDHTGLDLSHDVYHLALRQDSAIVDSWRGAGLLAQRGSIRHSSRTEAREYLGAVPLPKPGQPPATPRVSNSDIDWPAVPPLEA